MEAPAEQFPEQSQSAVEIPAEQFPEQPRSSVDRPEHQQSSAQIIADAGIEEIRSAVSSVSDVKIDIHPSGKKDFLLMTVIAVTCICIVIVTGKAAAGRKSQ